MPVLVRDLHKYVRAPLLVPSPLPTTSPSIRTTGHGDNLVSLSRPARSQPPSFPSWQCNCRNHDGVLRLSSLSNTGTRHQGFAQVFPPLCLVSSFPSPLHSSSKWQSSFISVGIRHQHIPSCPFSVNIFIYIEHASIRPPGAAPRAALRFFCAVDMCAHGRGAESR